MSEGSRNVGQDPRGVSVDKEDALYGLLLGGAERVDHGLP